ncbi:MAG: MarC family protein [Candidatus Pacearchaeota archaeon]
MEIFSISIILQIVILLNPLASVGVLFSAFKKGFNVKKMALQAVITAFFIALTIIFLGPSLFKVFNVTIDSFRIAGGIVILFLGIQTIWPSTEEKNKEIKKFDSLTSLIATPLLTGPATISFLTIKSLELEKVYLVGNLLISFLIVGTIFFIFAYLIKKINLRFVNILSKIIGLFLVAMAVEMITLGIKNIF